jgi:HK97 family phage major capsid protein
MSTLFTTRELSKYSVTKALAELATTSPGPNLLGEVGGLEGEVHTTLHERFQKATGLVPQGFLVPLNCLKNLNATTAASGGFLVGTDPASIVPALRNRTVVIDLGAQVWESLKDYVPVPRQENPVVGQWLDERTAATSSDTAFMAAQLKPHRCVGLTTVSKELLNQSSLGVENFIRSDFLRIIGVALDQGALVGSGGVQPLGILNTTGVPSVTFGGPATRTSAISFQTQLATVNGLNFENLSFVTSPTTAIKWQGVFQTGSTFPAWLWEGNARDGRVLGFPARSTNQITSNAVILGDFSQMCIGIWGDVAQIQVDPYAQKRSGLVEMMVTIFADVAISNQNGFCISTDSGAQ